MTGDGDTTEGGDGAEKLTLRDRLAMRRTALAGERTVLAYVRTAIMLIASGVTLLKLGPSGPIDTALAAAGIIAGLAVGVAAWVRGAATRDALRGERPDGSARG